VEVVCTTDDPSDTLEHHKTIAADSNFAIQVLPTFRPDKAIQFASLLPDGGHITPESLLNYNKYLDKLEGISGEKIVSLDDLFSALKKRHDFFHEMGCRLSDHGFDIFDFLDDEKKAESAFVRMRSGNVIDDSSALAIQSAVLLQVARWNTQRKWTMQLHIGALRNNNTRMFRRLGVDAGFDSIADGNFARPLSRFWDKLDKDEQLPKSIVYNLNGTANEMLGTMIGNFQDGSIPGKMQFGSGWWFLDQKDGMEAQIRTLSNLGLLSAFVGMLTDSRSFLSYIRHEYFRRILCNLLGNEMTSGEIPNDYNLIGNMINDICYNNAKRYFAF
ncbi:MAG: glucuronate isomerase, partial [Thermoguttaceae bacterium]